MRDIEFRAFNKKDKRFYEIMLSLNFDGKACSATFMSTLGDEKIVPIDEFELVEYTGLKDKNGKKIFEGDIVRHIGTTRTIQWDNYYLTLALSSGKSYISLTTDDASDIKIIGNIFENPELLKK